MSNSELYHHGVKGMKWGVRRYQNKDRSLTTSGKRRYSDENKSSKKGLTDKQKRAIKIGAAVTVTALVACGSYRLYKSGKLDSLINVGNKKVDSIFNDKAGSDFRSMKWEPSDKAKTISQKTGLKLKKTASSIEQSCKEANPDYDSTNKAYVNNCGKSVISDILNTIGLDVKAKGMSSDEQGGLNWFDILRPFKGSFVEDHTIPKSEMSSGQSCKESVSKRILEYCNNEDSIGIFRIGYVGRETGHYMKWQVKNGKVIYSNSQTGKMDVDKYFDGMAAKKIRRAVEFARVDNCEIDDGLLEHFVKNK